MKKKLFEVKYIPGFYINGKKVEKDRWLKQKDISKHNMQEESR